MLSVGRMKNTFAQEGENIVFHTCYDKPFGNPNGPNDYDTHIIMRTNCIVFLSSYDNFRHYCKICKANFAVRPWLLSSGGLLSCLSIVV